MAKKRRAKKPLDRLPNAPLTEVVFEMRWRLQGNPPFLTDPGIHPLTATFTPRAAKLGFPVYKDLANPDQIVGHSVTRRYFTAPDVGFPIIQIGSGVFASNQSSKYSWNSFKSQTLKALNGFLVSYPRLEGLPLVPIHLELRYIDVFGASLLGTTDLVDFANRGTTLGIQLPEMFSDKKLFNGTSDGRVLIQKEMNPSMTFVLDFATAWSASEKVLRLETKVVSPQAGVPKFRDVKKFVATTDKWLHTAHEITSPFFRKFVTSEVMDKFG